MSLTIYQKSVYLIIVNATMILRSVGKSLKGKSKTVKQFKIQVFKQIDKLIVLMDTNQLAEENIIEAIEKLSDEFEISFGQAQKAINVILKYHFYLSNNKNNEIKKILHCPLDSIILCKLKEDNLSLARINKQRYLEIQSSIQKYNLVRLDFDTQWDNQHLRDEGIL